MKIFDSRNRLHTKNHAEIVRSYEIIRTVIEFCAALCFVAGSVLFFYDDYIYAGTWLFVIGSLFFAFRPTIRLLLEFHLVNLPIPDEFRPYGTEREDRANSTEEG